MLAFQQSHYSFWQSLEAQLPIYMRSDDSKHGWFVAIRYDDGRASTEWLARLRETVSQAEKTNAVRLRYRIIDARPKESASVATAVSEDVGPATTEGGANQATAVATPKNTEAGPDKAK